MARDDGWSERYNCHSITVGHVQLSANWGSDGLGFKASCGMDPVSLRHRFHETEFAKRQAVVLAERVLRKALADIEKLKARMGIEAAAAQEEE